MPVVRTPIWDDTKGDALVGDFTKLLVGVRQDVQFDLSRDATLDRRRGQRREGQFTGGVSERDVDIQRLQVKSS